MNISDLTVEVRDSALTRVGQILPTDLVGLELGLRLNKVGAWRIVLRANHPLVDVLRLPGSGLIVTGPTGVLMSGPTEAATQSKTAADPEGTWEVIGVDDSVVLGERLAYPVPSSASLASQSVAYDTRTGKAETVAKAFVTANIGASAPVARRITALTVEADQARGNTVTSSARFDKLGELLSGILAPSDLAFDVRQVGSQLQFLVFAPTDRSGTVRMDVDNLRLSRSEYSYTAPGATRVIVAGQGDGAARTFIERTSTDSTAAESAWGRRIEVFKDQRNTADTAELQKAGDELLAERGKTVVGISVTPSDDLVSMQYGVEWGLGDKVTVVVDSLEVVQVVTEVAIVVTDQGVRVGATVGDPVAAAGSDETTQVVAVQAEQESRISNLERNEASSAATPAVASVPTGSLQMFAGASAPTGWLLADGSAISRTTYSTLFTAIGTGFGVGDGSTTFNLPDLRGRVAVGRGSGTFATLGATGGFENVTLDVNQIPSHTHANTASSDTQGGHSHSVSVSGGEHTHILPMSASGAPSGVNDRPLRASGGADGNFRTGTEASGSNYGSGTGTHTHSTSVSTNGAHSHNITVSNAAAGGNGAHTNLQPYQVLNYIIKT